MPDKTQQQYSLRKAQPGDLNSVELLMHIGGMGLASDWQEGIVAVDANGQVIGYIRIQQTPEGPHVAPVAVHPTRQGEGIGRALMEEALSQQGYLKLVARGEVAGFYRTLGCKEIPFEQISGDLEEDCQNCPDRDQCQPVAFLLNQENYCG